MSFKDVDDDDDNDDDDDDIKWKSTEETRI